MDPVDSAQAVAGRGLEGNLEQGGRRQVTLIDETTWGELERTLDSDVDPSHRRANVLVSGVHLAEGRGKVLKLGGCRIRLEGETRPCRRMDRAHPGLYEAMRTEWRGGAFGVVLDDAVIRVGDPVGWTTSD